MSDRAERWVAEYTPHGEDRARTFVVDYNSDDQFISNAAAWLREVWGNDGVVTIRHQKHENLGWVEDESREYEPRSNSSPYSVDGVHDANAVLGKKDTSRKAALATYPRTGTQRWRILQAVARRAGGYTRDELEVDLQLGGSSVHPRVLELIEGGWVHETEDRRPTRAGNEAVVLRVTARGQAEVASV